MTLRTWLGRRLARWTAGGREVAPRRHPLAATLTLDLLPDRDSPSSIDVGEFALVIGAGVAAGLETESRRTTATDRVDVSRPEPVFADVRWDSPIVLRQQPDAPARVLGLSDQLPAVPFPTPTTNRPNAGDASTPEARRQSEPTPAPLATSARSVPATGAAPAVVVDRPAEPTLPAVVRLTPAKPPAAKPAPPDFAGVPASAGLSETNVDRLKPGHQREAADPKADPEGDADGLRALIAGRIVWVDPPPAMPAPAPAADPIITLEHAPPEVPPPTVAPASPPPAASPEQKPGKAPYDPTPVLLPTADFAAHGYAAGDSAFLPPAEPSAIRPASPRVVIVSPIPAAGGQPVAPSTPVFHITTAADAGGQLVVPYTLAAHTAAGTITAAGAVTLTAGAGPVVITAGSALARRPADVLTLTARQRAGATRWASATVFLTPAHRAADAALFEAHRLARSPEAFRALVRRHGPAVTQACQRMVGNRADAEDVSQFVFLELARWRSQFSGTLAAWLRAVSRNASLAFLRAKRRRQRHEHEAARPVAADAAAIAVLDDTLAAAVAQLPFELAEAVRLRYLEGYSQQEAAAIVGCPRGTLSRRAAEGIQLLRERLERSQLG